MSTEIKQTERDIAFHNLESELLEHFESPKAIAERLEIKYVTYNRYQWAEGKKSYTPPSDNLLRHMSDVLKLIKISSVINMTDYG